MECDMELIHGKKTTPRCFDMAIGKIVIVDDLGETFEYYFCEEHKELAEKTTRKRKLEGCLIKSNKLSLL